VHWRRVATARQHWRLAVMPGFHDAP